MTEDLPRCTRPQPQQLPVSSLRQHQKCIGQLPFHLQVAKQQSAPPISDKIRKRYVSMPMKSLPLSGVSPMDPSNRSLSASVSIEALNAGQTIASSHGCKEKPVNEDNVMLGSRKPSGHTPFLGALTLPIYMYDCRLDSIISQLVHRLDFCDVIWHDIFKLH